MALRTYRYRLYPTKAQERLFEPTLDACRWVYNKMLEVRQAAWEERQENLNLFATNRLLTQWKKEHPSCSAQLRGAGGRGGHGAARLRHLVERRESR